MSNKDAFPDRLVLLAVPKWELSDRTQRYLVLEPFTYVSSVWGPVTVPEGEETDFGSVPAMAKWYVDDEDPDLLYGSVVHDYLYRTKGLLPDGGRLSRLAVDELLLEIMGVVGASWVKRQVVYRAVRAGGWVRWNQK